MTARESLFDARCPECGGARERDHCVEPGKRVGRIGCGWWKLADAVLTRPDPDDYKEEDWDD